MWHNMHSCTGCPSGDNAISCSSLSLLAQVREISNMVAPEPFRWTAEALLALQEVRGKEL